MRVVVYLILLITYQGIKAQSISDLHEMKGGFYNFQVKKFNNKLAYWLETNKDSIILDGVTRWHKLPPYDPIKTQGYFTLLDSNQQILLNLQFASKGNILIHDFNAGADSSFLLAFNYGGDTLKINDAVFSSENNNHGALCITKIKKDGHIAFCKSFQGYPLDAQIAALPDGRIVVSGTTSYDNMNFDGIVLPSVSMGIVSDADFFVAILDSTGHVLHVKRFGGTSWDYCRHLLTTDDGSIYLTGSFYSPEFKIDSLTLISQGGGKFGLADALLLKLDSTLYPIWAKQVRGYGIQRGFFVDMDAVGRLYWGFEFTNYQSYLEEDTLHGGLDNAMICQLDTAGAIIWKRGFATNNYSYISSLSFDPDHNFWLAVSYEDSLRFGNNSLLGVAKWDYALVKMSPEGAFLRWFNIIGPSWESINYIQTIGDQQLFVAGSTDSLSFLNLNIESEFLYDYTHFHFIINLNTVGIQAAAQEAIDLAVFPNPVQAGGLLRVVLQGAVRNGQVRLYNALGRIVAQTKVPDYAAQITFPAPRQPGMYYFVLQTGEQRAVSTIVVEQ